MKGSLAIAPLEGAATTESPGLVDRAARRLVLRTLGTLRVGTVHILDRGQERIFGQIVGDRENADDDLQATIQVHSPRAYRAVAFGGTVGAGRAYMEGLWSTDDLPALVRIFALNSQAHFGLEGGLAMLSQPVNRLFHFLRRNTRTGSRRNISQHYDLGNEFYRLFLDESLTYSCGIFETPEASMLDASTAKYDRLCRKLDLGADDDVLEIGCGWGGFALHAAANYGCRVTTTTISRQQYELTKKRVDAAGLSERVRVMIQDYRDLKGEYDKLVSIEMIEAVGHEYLDSFFRCCARLLRPEGRMAIQSITIADQFYDRHRNEVDFIKRYIFPGSTIPSTKALVESMTQASDLRVFHLEDITQHYVTTLKRWREAFHARLDEVYALGFSDRFVRMWDFYLAYCQGGFAERYLGNVQMVLVKPQWRDVATSS